MADEAARPKDGLDTALAHALGQAILSSTAPDAADGRRPSPLALLRTTVAAETATRALVQQSIAAARTDGASWAVIGAELGMTRQAAQQRFGGSRLDDRSPGGANERRWLGPVTALDEMAELEIAGRLGWHTIEAGMLRHRMVRTSTQWEHKRIWWTQLAKRRTDGWEVGCRAFPWIYLVRDTGLRVDDPQLSEEPAAL